MIRVVIDTNILVSALLGEEQLCVSDAGFAEYGDVIRLPHLKRPPDVIEGTLRSIRKQGHRVKPGVRVDECSDPDDNIFLECAQAGEADYLVTGNQRHFPERWKKTKVTGARELIELLIEREK